MHLYRIQRGGLQKLLPTFTGGHLLLQNESAAMTLRGKIKAIEIVGGRYLQKNIHIDCEWICERHVGCDGKCRPKTRWLKSDTTTLTFDCLSYYIQRERTAGTHPRQQRLKLKGWGEFLRLYLPADPFSLTLVQVLEANE